MDPDLKRSVEQLFERIQRTAEAEGGTVDIIRVSVPHDLPAIQEAVRLVSELFDAQGVRVVVDFVAPEPPLPADELEIEAEYHWIQVAENGPWLPGQKRIGGWWLVPGQKDPVRAAKIGDRLTPPGDDQDALL